MNSYYDMLTTIKRIRLCNRGKVYSFVGYCIFVVSFNLTIRFLSTITVSSIQFTTIT